MTQYKVVEKFETLGCEPIFNQTTGSVDFYDFPNMEFSITDSRIILHFPGVAIVHSSLATFAKFNDLMFWFNKQIENYKGINY